ncbi:MAG: RnfABCDGE type electron transport complex subunit G [Tissierellia bacterium]|nr:RnfABCDGE type electron transport complex subunit G [Tissierellia bacterium]
MKETIKTAVTLLVIAAIAGGLLSAIHSVTKPIIDENARIASLAKYTEIYGDGADNFEDLDAETMNSISEKYPNVHKVMTATKNGEIVGYVFNVLSSGYDGKMDNALIINTEGEIVGFRNLAHTETPGFGDRITTPEFYEVFQGKSANTELKATADGAGDDEFMAISGATISTNAVLRGVNEVISAYNEFFAN